MLHKVCTVLLFWSCSMQFLSFISKILSLIKVWSGLVTIWSYLCSSGSLLWCGYDSWTHTVQCFIGLINYYSALVRFIDCHVYLNICSTKRIEFSPSFWEKVHHFLLLNIVPVFDLLCTIIYLYVFCGTYWTTCSLPAVVPLVWNYRDRKYG